MAQIIFKGVPDFTEVRAEVTKIKQEIASVSATPIKLTGTEQGLKNAANAAGSLAGNLQKVATSFDANGNATRKVADYSAKLGETTRVIAALNQETGKLTVAGQTVTQNFQRQAQAAEKAAAAELKATRQANAYLQQQAQAAQSTPYEPTALQRQIEALTGVSVAGKSAAESAKTFEREWLTASEKVSAANQKAETQAQAYLRTQAQAAQSTVYNPTAMQRQIEGMVGIGNAAKNAADSANVFERAFLDASDKIQSGTKQAAEQTGLLGDSFTNVYKKMLVWQVMGTIVSKTIGAFRDAVSTMKSVDDELVTVRKVTGFTAEQMEALRDKAYETASAYDEAADEYLNSVAAFARAGYGEQADALAELATKTKLVGDTNAETAQQFLLSVDAAYQYNGSVDKLTKVLDGANEIDNKYATSIEKIAEGLGTVAPVAAQAHVGIDELTAAIGTITAVTQRSGSEAARAFRALVLNIVGDTKTEIDEGVTWTTGEIAGLRDVIRQYAPAAYEAAKATGEVIDPMEAIGGLAQSMKDGLLTEQKLMNMVSDIGGKLRTSQLLALIQNWDMYQSMLQDYGNAVGSADKEIENALDSWTRKTNILKNEWTQFISSMVNTDAIKLGLDGLIGVVKGLDTDFGRLVVTAGALSLGLVGVQAAAKGAEAAIVKLSAAGIAMNPWIVLLSAAAAGFGLLWDATEDTRKSIDELDTAISDNTDKLEENRRRLAEINALGWNEKTPEILNEKAALEQENAELERQIEKQKELEARQANRTLKSAGGYVGTGETEYHLTSMGESRGGAEALGLTGRTFGSYAELTQYLDQYIPGAAEKSRQELEALGVQFEETEKKAYQTGETYETALIVKASSLSKKLKENRGDLGDLQEEYDSVTTGLARFAQAHEVLGDNASDAKAALDTLNQAYDAAADYAATYGDAVEVTGEQAEAVSKTYPKLADSIAKVGDQYVVCKSSALNAADGLIAANGRISGSAKATAKATLTQLKSIAAGYQEVASLAMAAYSADQSRENYENLKNAFLLSTKAQGAMNRLQNAISDSEKYGYNASTDSASSSGTKKSGKSSSSKSTKDAELERLKDIVSLRKSELTLMQERGDSTADQIAKMRQIQSALHDEAEYLRKIGGSQADINALSTEHWKITKQIQELQKDLWSELEDAVNKKLDEAAEARDKQTAAIDKQIEALKDAKETEDEALKLEELRAAVIEKQNALLEAQSERTVRVFNAATGQWEWEANAATVKSAEDAYEKAKEDLAEYERELALQKEIDELEAKKQLIEDTYDTLKAEWEKITDSLQEPTREIDDILSDLAANGTPKMREQVEAVNDILGKLNDYIAGAMNDIQAAGEQAAAAASGSGSGGGYHFDYDKNPSGGWTDAEMNEGFKSSGSSSSGWRDSAAEATGTKSTVRGADLSRRTDLAGKTVGQGSMNVTYDKNGYVEKATRRTTDAVRRNKEAASSTYDSGGILQGMGGIKATSRDEIVIPPILAEKMLEPSADSVFQKRMGELGWLYGAGDRGQAPLEKTVMSRTSYDHYGDSYSVNGVKIGAEAANNLSIAQVMRALNSGAGNLGLFKN